MNETRGSIVRIKLDEVTWRLVGNELIVLEFSTSTYLTLNGTAKDLWEMLVNGATIQSLSEMLIEKYRVTVERADADAEAFVTALGERGLLQSDS